MQLKIYTIRDSKGEMFHPPFYNKTHGEAERNFRELVNDEKSMLSKYPEDYDLYFCGEWDDNTGKFTPKDSPEHLVKAVSVQKQVQ